MSSAHELSLHLCHSSFANPSFASPTSQALHLIEQSSFYNLSVTSPTSQLTLQPFRRFTHVTAHSQTLPLLHLRQSSFSNPDFASPTSQALHLIHLASCPCSSHRNWLFVRVPLLLLLLGFTTLFNILGHQRRFRHGA